MIGLLAWSDTATATVVVGVIVIVGLILGRKLTVKVGNVEATVGAIYQQTNGRSPTEPTVSDDVREIRREVAVLRVAMSTLHGQNVRRLDAQSQLLGKQSERLHDLEASVTKLVEGRTE